MSKRLQPPRPPRSATVEARRRADFRAERERPPDYEWDLGDPRLSRRWGVPTDADVYHDRERGLTDIALGRGPATPEAWHLVPAGDVETLWRLAFGRLEGDWAATKLGTRLRADPSARAYVAAASASADKVPAQLTARQARPLEDAVVAWLGGLHAPQAIVESIARDAPDECAALLRFAVRLKTKGLRHLRHLPWLVLMGFPFWVRPLSSWQGDSASDLFAHLFATYPLPSVLGSVLASDRWLWSMPARQEPAATRYINPLAWTILKGQGGSIERVSRRLGWGLSRALIEQAEAVDLPGCQFHEMLACGELRRLGGGEADWVRMRRVHAFTLDHRLPVSWPFRFDPGPADYLPTWSPAYLAFWRDTARWLARHRAQLSDDEAELVLRWADHEAAERPDFEWKGRSAARSLQAARAYWTALHVAIDAVPQVWPAHGWDWTWRDEEGGVEWQIAELTSSLQLRDEGAAQMHCVAAYADKCVAGQAAILQLLCDGRRRATVEVDPRDRSVVQARTRGNGRLSYPLWQVLKRWRAERLDL